MSQEIKTRLENYYLESYSEKTFVSKVKKWAQGLADKASYEAFEMLLELQSELKPSLRQTKGFQSYSTTAATETVNRITSLASSYFQRDFDQVLFNRMQAAGESPRRYLAAGFLPPPSSR